MARLIGEMRMRVVYHPVFQTYFTQVQCCHLRARPFTLLPSAFCVYQCLLLCLPSACVSTRRHTTGHLPTTTTGIISVYPPAARRPTMQPPADRRSSNNGAAARLGVRKRRFGVSTVLPWSDIGYGGAGRTYNGLIAKENVIEFTKSIYQHIIAKTVLKKIMANWF